jgi:hypothetical protein
VVNPNPIDEGVGGDGGRDGEHQKHRPGIATALRPTHEQDAGGDEQHPTDLRARDGMPE